MHYWHPWQPAVDYATRHAHGTVVELGPGFFPFESAIIKVGRGTEHDIDLCRDPLPFEDQSVDFLYCRHTLEDLDDPVHLLREIRRVAKHGWLETPSPMAELTRGVDAPLLNGDDAPWRGYLHHRWIFWNDAGTLKFCAKYAGYLEHFSEDIDFWDYLAHPKNWNTYFLFGKRMEWEHLEHELHYNVITDYGQVLESAVNAAVISCDKYATSFWEM